MAEVSGWMVVDDDVRSWAEVGISLAVAGMGLTVAGGWGVEAWDSVSESSSQPMFSVGDMAAPKKYKELTIKNIRLISSETNLSTAPAAVAPRSR